MNQHEIEEEIDKESIVEFQYIKCIFYGLVFGLWIMSVIAVIIM
jgi:hypothetical protein